MCAYRSHQSSKRPYGGGHGGSYGGGYGRGHGGGGGRPPHRGGGGGGFNSRPQPTELKVLTNQNRLILSSDGASDNSDYMQCEVTLKNAFWRKVRVKNEATGEETETGEREFVSKDRDDEEKTRRFLKTPLPWRIMKKWSKEQKIEVAYDGAFKAYFPSVAHGPELGREYQVKIKRDCEEDDPDAERVRNSWFAVTFENTISIPHANIMSAIRGTDSSEEISTMLNVILKSGAVLTDGMISLEPNSSKVFFPLDMQRNMLGRGVSQETRDGTKILLSGLRMTVVFQRGGAFLQTESIVQYADKNYFDMFSRDQRHRRGERVPLLKTDRGVTIAGISIGNANRPIEGGRRAMIEEAIGKKNIMVEYVNKKPKPGKDPSRIYKGKSLRNDRDDNSRGKGRKVIWSACDPTEYSFDHNGEEKTVASFFESEYGIVLKFPYMPIICIDVGRNGTVWLPIEFAYQEFVKSKENNEDMVNTILKFFDVNAGKEYVHDVGRKLDRLSETGEDGALFKDRLAKWRIKIDDRPVEEIAKVLKAPRIKFKDNVAQSNNGSFNLQRAAFSLPAKVYSFAVVNFDRDQSSCRRYVQNVLRVAQNHGVDIPSTIMDISNDDRHLDRVTEHYNGRDDVGDALEALAKAIQKAKVFHLYDSQDFYKRNNSYFKTHCFSEEEEELECVVLPPMDEKGPLGLILDYKEYNKDTQFFSHEVTTHDGSVHKARLMIKISSTTTLIDPLDFRFDNHCHQACRRDGTWKNVMFKGTCYKCPQEHSNDLILDECDVQSKKFVHLAGNWEIDFPSIVFVYKPDDGKPLYNRIKLMSNHLGGIQTQCAVKSKYEGQRNKDQYASNISTKINAKLSTIYDKAVSWTSESNEGSGGESGLPWIGELPTLVIGVGLVHGMGYSSKTVVIASVCLDSKCMRLSHSCFVQKKSDVISSCVMKDIVEVSIKHYVIENNCGPKRILFYRDGMSDGSFHRANDEVASIREAAEEKLEARIPITFVICQSQQLGFKMAPSEQLYVGPRNKPNANCLSGTVLENGPNSFYLIAQGGMKGTSKPVKYIVHLNENENPAHGHGGLTIQNLIKCTNQMSWNYPSATKAVRELPLIKYAKKLGNQVLPSLLCLQEGCHWFGKDIRLVCPAEDAGSEEEMRPYIEMTTADGDIARHHNIVEMPFRNHLAG